MMKSEIFLEVKVVGNLWASHNMYKKVKIRICCSSFLFFGIKFVKKKSTQQELRHFTDKITAFSQSPILTYENWENQTLCAHKLRRKLAPTLILLNLSSNPIQLDNAKLCGVCGCQSVSQIMGKFEDFPGISNRESKFYWEKKVIKTRIKNKIVKKAAFLIPFS